jgi:hypothetical protein
LSAKQSYRETSFWEVARGWLAKQKPLILSWREMVPSPARESHLGCLKRQLSLNLSTTVTSRYIGRPAQG